MEVVKRVLRFIIDPFHKFGSRGFSDQVSKFFSKHKYVTYIIAFIISVTIVCLYYFL